MRKRMLPLLEPFQLRWLEEPVIPDDIQGYAALKAAGRIPIAGGEHEHTHLRIPPAAGGAGGGLTSSSTPTASAASHRRARSQALAEAYPVPVIPHAGQMHNFHVVMASFNSPMAEFFPMVDVEIGNELFWYIFDGEPKPVNGAIDLRDDVPGLGLTISEDGMKNFAIIE